MESKNIETRKIKFVQEFLDLKSERIISELERLLRTETGKSFEPMSSTEYESQIDEAMEDSKNGRMVKATDLKAKIQKWV